MNSKDRLILLVIYLTVVLIVDCLIVLGCGYIVFILHHSWLWFIAAFIFCEFLWKDKLVEKLFGEKI
jgi:hypothetical protein